MLVLNNNIIQIGAVGGPYAEGLFHSASTYINGDQTFACYKGVCLPEKEGISNYILIYPNARHGVCLPEKEGISNSYCCLTFSVPGVCLPEKEGISNLSVLFAPEHHGVCLPEKEGISNQAAEDYYAFVAYVYLKKKVYPTWRSS